jgi:anti-anti-sigma factor
MAVRRFPVSGDLDLATVPDLETKLTALVYISTDDLELDCTGLTFCDSTGIAMFLRVHDALARRDRELRIVNMDSRVRRPFDAVGVTEILGIAQLDSA